jgi:cell division septation protein DedD
MNKLIAVLLIASIVVSGCAHTTANPVLLAQPGDENKTCDGIANEMQQMIDARSTAESDRNKQIGANVLLGIAGVFLIVPWFFMDVGNTATVEERAAQARFQRLNQMAIDKKCPATPTQASSPVPSNNQATTTTVGNPDAAAVRPATAAMKTNESNAAMTPTKKLEALDEMLKKGLITQDEFNSKKQEVLKSM